MLWLYFALSSAIIIALVNLFDKYILTNLVKRSEVYLFYVFLMSLIAFLVIIFSLSISLLSFFEILISIISGLFFSLMVIFFFKASFIEEISRTVSYFYLSPVFVSTISFIFLGEILGIFEYIGMIFVVLGAFLISKKGNRIFSIDKPVALMLASALSFSLYNVLVDYLLLSYDFWTVFAYTRIGVLLGFLPFLYKYRSSIIDFFRNSNLKNISIPFINEILAIFGMLVTVIAISFGPVTLVNTMLVTRPIFVLIFSQVIAFLSPNLIREKYNKKEFLVKLFSIILMFCGSVFILIY